MNVGKFKRSLAEGKARHAGMLDLRRKTTDITSLGEFQFVELCLVSVENDQDFVTQWTQRCGCAPHDNKLDCATALCVSNVSATSMFSPQSSIHRSTFQSHVPSRNRRDYEVSSTIQEI